MSDILSSKTVTTRKPHVCHGCNTKYPEGTKMNAVSWADGGSVGTTYWCPTCQEYWNRHMQFGDEIGIGELLDNDPEGWIAINAELREE